MRIILAALVAVAAGAAATPPSVLDLRVIRADGSVAALREVTSHGPALIAFWATYCPPCRAEVPALNRAAERWRARGLTVLGVALEDDAARVKDAHDTWAMRYDTLRIAPDQAALVDRLFPRGLPAAAFVAHGTAMLHDDFLDDATVERLVPPSLDDARSGGGDIEGGLRAADDAHRARGPAR